MDIVSISSYNKTSGDNNDFEIRYGNPISNVRGFKLLNIIIPSTYYMVMSGINDKIYIYAGAVLYTATLTEGNYDTSSFPTHIQTQINAAYTPDNNFSVSLSSITEKFTITHTGELYQNGRTPDKVLTAISELIKNGKIDPDEIKVLFVGGGEYSD